MSKKPTSIDSLLANTERPRRPNAVADNAELAESIQQFLALKAADDERVAGLTLSWFYKEKLQPLHDGPVWFGTVRKYVREHLGLDHNTGKAL